MTERYDVPSRSLDFDVFDADNHMYETKEALTKHVPDQYSGVIDYVEVKGRTKILVNGTVSEYIPNPTFDVIAKPGAQEEYFKRGNPEGKSYREIVGEPMRAVPAFREPGPRLELMDELGIDRALMFPTLASLVEERLRDDVRATHAIIHALNEWMLETWTYEYEGRIFPTPVITLPIVERAIEELEWVVERGAKVVLIRPAPVPSLDGTSRSPGLPEFDALWQRVVDLEVLVAMHASDSGYARYVNDWEGTREFLPFKLSAFRSVAMGHRPIEDAMAAMICHGALSRFPDLRIAVVENGSGFVRPLFHNLKEAYRMMPQAFMEHPIDVFKRNVYVHPFHEEDIRGLVELLGVDHVLFGSDFPHPEGMADPITYVDELQGMPHDDIVKIMGGNLARLMRIGVAA
jgi:predicted TIM-barrel fold metal-dependent hydrolase